MTSHKTIEGEGHLQTHMPPSIWMVYKLTSKLPSLAVLWAFCCVSQQGMGDNSNATGSKSTQRTRERKIQGHPKSSNGNLR